jgi:hypothetical protein
LSVTCDKSVVFSGYSGFLNQYNWQPRYNWNIVKSGVKHHSPNQTFCSRIVCSLYHIIPRYCYCAGWWNKHVRHGKFRMELKCDQYDVMDVDVFLTYSTTIKRSTFDTDTGRPKQYKLHSMCGVMVSVLVSRTVDREFEPRSGKPKAIQLVFLASPLRTQH